MSRRGAAVLAVWFVLAAPAAALDFPALTGRVVDEAGILDAAMRASLAAKLEALEAKSTDQLVVVTVTSLQGTSIEDFGVQLGRRWQIGQQGKNNGAILIVAPNERKVRIEVGYGLEGTLTDAMTRFIIETSIIPRFRAGDVAGGITRGVDDIIQVLTGDAEDWKQRAARSAANAASPADVFFTFLFVAVAVFIVLNVLLGMMRSTAPGNRRNRPWIASGPIAGSSWGSPSSGSSGGGFADGGGFSGGGGSFGGGGASGSW
jgi:uncharacterized protein